jgi:hypothetical protein
VTSVQWRRRWLRVALGAGMAWLLAPSVHLFMAIQRTSEMGTAIALLFVTAPMWLLFFMPGVIAVSVALVSGRARWAPFGFVVAGGLMVAWASVAMVGFAEQGDVHLWLWAPWALAAACGLTVLAAGCTLTLVQLKSERLTGVASGHAG